MKKILLAILFAAAYLRFTGIYPGYPPYHADEGMSYSQGIYILIDGTLDANGYSLHYAYPGLIPILNALFFKLIFIPFSWGKFYISNIGMFVDGLYNFPLTTEESNKILQLSILGIREIHVLTWGRIIAASVGVGNVLLTYLLAKKMFAKEVALLSSVFVAVNYRQVLNSHLALPDIYNAFFLLLSLLLTYRIIDKPSIKSYLLAGIGAGLSFSTKFHVYAIPPLLLAHFYFHFKNKSALIGCLFDKKIFIAGLSIMVITLIINPYHFIHFEQFREQIVDVSLKYKTGKNEFDFFPYSYLYHYGLGRVTSVLVILGIISIFTRFKEKLMLLSVIVPFLIVITFLTGGGFYTRNFITVTPLLMIFASAFVVQISKSVPKKVGLLIIIPLIGLALFENISKSVVVGNEYRQEWNYLITKKWIEENIPPGSKIAAHSSVNFDSVNYERLPFDQKHNYSMEEFNDADFVAINLEWMTNEFYWWMSQGTMNSLKYWNKPVELLEEAYPALVIREYSDYSIFSITNPALAPESDFVVVKIPDRDVRVKNLLLEFTFNKNEKVNFRSWSSNYFSVDNIKGLMITHVSKLEGLNSRDGFVFVEYFKNASDATERKNRTAVRISPRITSSEFTKQQFAHAIPKNSSYAVVSIGVYQESQSDVYFDKLEVFEADVSEDFGGWTPNPIKLDTDIVFPNSHGNL
ncbi:glycosyltransferase family 39 protein [Candidatus Woesebacteria bacterium]|nr:MAG: glycosyltransferase family 39 protein [Candidatus Woesebacteria bacterium]